MAPRKNGPVVTATINPDDADRPDIIAAAIAAAKAEALAKRQQRATKTAPVARVKLTAPQAEAMEAIGWKAPAVDAANTWKPEPRTRQNNCAGDAAYGAALAILKVHGALAVGDLAQVWEGCNLKPRALAGVCQQLANRAGRTVQQEGGTLTLA